MYVFKDFYVNIFGFYAVWMLWATAIAAFLLIVIVFLILKKREDYKRFTTFNRYDVVWKWKYKSNQIVSLWCYCPSCGARLVCDDEHSKSAFLGEKNTFLICNACGESEKGRVTGGDRNHVLRVVKNEIYRLIKTGQYKKIL